MSLPPKLTPKAACRVAQIDRDRLNEDIASGLFPCAPNTSPGRARLFDPHDMVALWLYRELQTDGYSKEVAGKIACEVSTSARENPCAETITFQQSYFDKGGRGRAAPTEDHLPAAKWHTHLESGTDVRKATTFNIKKIKDLIAHYTEEERSIIGSED